LGGLPVAIRTPFQAEIPFWHAKPVPEWEFARSRRVRWRISAALESNFLAGQDAQNTEIKADFGAWLTASKRSETVLNE
jgi:hypothetical protein